jgi:hypothetical membrane protein
VFSKLIHPFVVRCSYEKIKATFMNELRTSKKIKIFIDKYPLVGPMFWLISIQYFIVMSLVAWAWPTHYSALDNTISDLGNTACGIYSGRYVCSPQHVWMNASFIALGITMIFGSALIYHEFRKNVGSLVGFSFMGLAGFGLILVGIFAENTISSLHIIGAALPFVIGNLALIILGITLDLPKWLKLFSVIAGIVSLAAFILFVSHNYLDLGIGGMERLAAHPQTIWLIVFGLYMSRNRFKNIYSKS